MLSLQSEKHFYCVFIYLGSDDAEFAGYVGSTGSYICFTRYIIEVDPVSVFAGDDALGTEDHAEIAAVELFESGLDCCLGEGSGCLESDGIEDFVCMVMTLVIMVVAAAGAVRAMVVMMFVLMFVIMVMIVVVMMLVIMIMLVVVFMLVIMFIVVMVMFMFVMVMVVAAACAIRSVIMIMIMVMMVCVLFRF